MPSSYCQLAAHIVFSTKNWQRWLKIPLREELHKYLAGIITNLKGNSILINSMDDHVHILCLLPKDMGISEFMAKVKANSSRWFRLNHNDKFNWQEGYAAFSVGIANMSQVKSYIANQQKHHATQTGMAEYEQMLEAYSRGIADALKPQ